jgi:hypothetical protein
MRQHAPRVKMRPQCADDVEHAPKCGEGVEKSNEWTNLTTTDCFLDEKEFQHFLQQNAEIGPKIVVAAPGREQKTMNGFSKLPRLRERSFKASYKLPTVRQTFQT